MAQPQGSNLGVAAPLVGPIPSVFPGIPRQPPVIINQPGVTIYVGTGPVFGSGVSLSLPLELVFLKPSTLAGPPVNVFTLDSSPLDGPDPLGPAPIVVRTESILIVGAKKIFTLDDSSLDGDDPLGPIPGFNPPYIGTLPVSFPAGQFDRNTYVVYTFADDDLDEVGVWRVYVRKNGIPISGIGTFRVSLPVRS